MANNVSILAIFWIYIIKQLNLNRQMYCKLILWTYREYLFSNIKMCITLFVIRKQSRKKYRDKHSSTAVYILKAEMIKKKKVDKQMFSDELVLAQRDFVLFLKVLIWK